MPPQGLVKNCKARNLEFQKVHNKTLSLIFGIHISQKSSQNPYLLKSIFLTFRANLLSFGLTVS